MKGKTIFVIVAMSLGLLMSALDNTITSAAINHIISDIGGFDQMSWIFTSYILASTSTMLIFGKMSDLFGRKRLYLIGAALFLIGSTLCGFSQNMDQLIWFRIIQGIGAGAILPISFTIIYTLFKDPKDAVKLSGVFAGIFGLASVAGPQLGTWLSEYFGWRYCFYVNVPIGIISFLILLFALKETRSQRKVSIDYVGTLLLIISTISFLLGLEWGGSRFNWLSLPTLLLFLVSVVGVLLFVFVERRVEEPILPLKLFRNRMVAGTSLVVLCQGAIMFSAITYLPILSVAVLGAKNSNSLLSPMMFSLIAGAVFFGFLFSYFSFRALMMASMAMGIVGGYLLIHVSPTTSMGYIIFIMILLGFGAIGPLMSIAQYAMSSSVEEKYMGIINSVVGFWRNIGGILGASLTATIVNNYYADTVHKTNNMSPAFENPEVLMKSMPSIPSDTLLYLKEVLSNAINKGFIIIICFAIVGLIAASIVGKRKAIKAANDN